ncbi:MAG: hypothetical protein CTY25_03650 [Methylobacterium sp.]|nr:MAG: hypothetical protein CTY25_03650 [Methylobacterium sp.]
MGRMDVWNSFYENPTVVGMEWGHERIYAAPSYRLVRFLCDAPVTLGECQVLARWYPLCWRRSDDGLVLVALRSLLPEGEGHYPENRAPLPLCLQAYPFAVPDPESIERQQLVVDRVIADRPTDVGAPIVMANGRMSTGAVIRARLALQVARGLQATTALSRDLDAAGLLEPWPLDFDLGQGRRAGRSDLSVIAASQLGNPLLATIVERHGVDAGLFMAYQRISLFRIGFLLQLAKAGARPEGNAAALELS